MVCAIKAPGFGDSRRANLEDLAILTGGEVSRPSKSSALYVACYSPMTRMLVISEPYPLSPDQVLLRDSKLRNTDYIYGVIIFSGPDTKVVRNSTISPSKRRRIERKINHVIYVLFSILVLISLVTSIYSAMYKESDMVNSWYLRLEDEKDQDPSFNPTKPVVSSFLQFVRALILAT